MTTSRRLFQMATLAALTLTGVSLWVGWGPMPGADAGLADADWSPDIKTLDISAGPLASGNAFPETLARPLFSPTRKPPGSRPPEPVAQQPPGPEPMPQPSPVEVTAPDAVILKGIFIDEERQLALIQTPTAPQGTWLAAGALVEGWTISRIDRQGIALEAQGQSARLSLYVDKPAN